MASGKMAEAAGAALAGRTKHMPRPSPVAATPMPRTTGKTDVDRSCRLVGLVRKLDGSAVMMCLSGIAIGLIGTSRPRLVVTDQASYCRSPTRLTCRPISHAIVDHGQMNHSHKSVMLGRQRQFRGCGRPGRSSKGRTLARSLLESPRVAITSLESVMDEADIESARPRQNPRHQLIHGKPLTVRRPFGFASGRRI
jgi:hypothetical protein